ncbi:MAG: ATP-binding cassette domain-containing protein [Oscillospiraceae bacterium]|nr:ATP-binding cassette domain-containing protein [Oscillospiraceae bacterium]
MFQIDLKSRTAIYTQIVDNIKRLVDSGMLRPDEGILSIRDLAKTLTINPNTVKTAYLELENQGYLYSERGKTWFVATPGAETQRNKYGDVAGIYGRIQADIRELILRGEDRELLEDLIGLGEKPFIECDNITKRFDEVLALDHLHLSVKKGSIYGLVGVNGSGKTTVMRILSGLLRSDNGAIRIDGLPDEFHDLTIGYMPEDLYFLPQYSLKMLRKYTHNKHKKTWNEARYQALLALLGLNEDQLISTFSRGMQKQASFLLTISAMPDILLLDETLDGLDPIVRRLVLAEIIEDVADRQMTALVSSHNIDELDGICDTVGILNKGHMVIQRNLDEMKTNVHKVIVAFRPDLLTKRYPYDGLEVLHMEECGSTDVLIVRGKEADISAHLMQFEPLVYEHLPLKLEELFVYERSGDLDETTR